MITVLRRNFPKRSQGVRPEHIQNNGRDGVIGWVQQLLGKSNSDHSKKQENLYVVWSCGIVTNLRAFVKKRKDQETYRHNLAEHIQNNGRDGVIGLVLIPSQLGKESTYHSK